MKLDPQFSLSIKIKSRWMKGLNLRPASEFDGKKISGKTGDIHRGVSFLNRTLNTANKSKINQISHKIFRSK